MRAIGVCDGSAFWLCALRRARDGTWKSSEPRQDQMSDGCQGGMPRDGSPPQATRLARLSRLVFGVRTRR